MSMWQYALSNYPVYLLVLLRMAGFIGTSPFLSMQAWPAPAKVGLAAFTALWVAPTLHVTVPNPFTNAGVFVVDALTETVTGMFLGMVASMMVSAVTIAGQAFDIDIGFSSAVLFDPSAGASVGISSSFLSWIFTVFFLGIGGLDGLMLALMKSYQFIPLGVLYFPSNTWSVLSAILGLAMTIGIQMVAPMLVAMLLSDLTFALLSRAVPQMNVFIVGFPAKLFVGLTLFAAVMPGVVYVMNQLFQVMFAQLNGVLLWLGG